MTGGPRLEKQERNTILPEYHRMQESSLWYIFCICLSLWTLLRITSVMNDRLTESGDIDISGEEESFGINSRGQAKMYKVKRNT